jgi:leader peptidase (prepilin peptidase) / N-methyltransferase
MGAALDRRQAEMSVLGSWIWPVVLSPFIGSFLGVVVTRVELPLAIIFGRSACAFCGTQLAARDLIPLGSWVALRGRCRSCRQRIALFHPIMELGALLVALWSASLFSGGLLWASCILGWTLLTLAATDLKYFLLPDFITLPAIGAGLFAAWLFRPSMLLANVIAAAAGYAFIAVLRQVYRRLRGREGIGLGDAKLLAAAGAWVSWEGLPSVILLGALTGLGYALFRNKGAGTLSLGVRVPFGTFLCLGTWIVWLYGPFAIG